MTLYRPLPPATDTIAPPSAGRGAGLLPAAITLAVLIVVVVVSLMSLQPSRRQPASVPVTEFSADRAMTLLDGIATVAHPTGSPAQGRVRDHLAAQLRRAGLEPQSLTRVATRSAQDRPASAGAVTDLYATIPGRQATGRVLLVAHYDSVPLGPGASDNGANVAAVLEIARALRAGDQPRNDVGVLFTDGEEQGLLGAQAYVDSGVAGDPGRVVVLNFEARGSSGPAVMFQMAGTGLTSAVRATGAVTTSMADEVYRVLPSDTDLTAFDEAGMRGLNLAFFGGAANYHTSHDDISHVSRDSVQDMGNAGMAGARQLADADLTASGSRATYFSLFGALVSYPDQLVLPIAVVTLIGFGLLLLRGRRSGLSIGGVVRVAATFPLCLIGAAVIGIGGWYVLTAVRADLSLTRGNLYRPVPLVLAEALLLLVVLVGWYRLARRRGSALDVATGVLGWFCVFALAAAVLLPGGAYLFTWPALAGVVAIAVALRWTAPDSRWRVAAGCAAAVPGVALLVPAALLLVPTLGLALMVVPLLLEVMLLAAVVGVLEPLPPRRALTTGMLAVTLAAVTTLAVAVGRDDYGPARPRPVSLGYLLEADSGTATWVGRGSADQPVVGRFLTGGPVHLYARVPSLDGGLLNSGPAQPAPSLAGPSAEPLSAQAQDPDAVRSLQVRVRAPVGAYAVDVYADTTAHSILDASVEGVELGSGTSIRPAKDDGGWRWGFTFAAPPQGGLDLRLRVRGEGPLRLRIIAISAGLPSGVGAPTLTPDLSWAGWPSVAGQTFVTRTVQL